MLARRFQSCLIFRRVRHDGSKPANARIRMQDVCKLVLDEAGTGLSSCLKLPVSFLGDPKKTRPGFFGRPFGFPDTRQNIWYPPTSQHGSGQTPLEALLFSWKGPFCTSMLVGGRVPTPKKLGGTPQKKRLVFFVCFPFNFPPANMEVHRPL